MKREKDSVDQFRLEKEETLALIDKLKSDLEALNSRRLAEVREKEREKI